MANGWRPLLIIINWIMSWWLWKKRSWLPPQSWRRLWKIILESAICLWSIVKQRRVYWIRLRKLQRCCVDAGSPGSLMPWVVLEGFLSIWKNWVLIFWLVVPISVYREFRALPLFSLHGKNCWNAKELPVLCPWIFMPNGKKWKKGMENGGLPHRLTLYGHFFKLWKSWKQREV